jgi:hypothetical protein
MHGPKDFVAIMKLESAAQQKASSLSVVAVRNGQSRIRWDHQGMMGLDQVAPIELTTTFICHLPSVSLALVSSYSSR